MSYSLLSEYIEALKERLLPKNRVGGALGAKAIAIGAAASKPDRSIQRKQDPAIAMEENNDCLW